LLVKKGTRKAMLDIEKKPSKIEDNERNAIDFLTKATIILCLLGEILYSVMNEKITAGIWGGLESLYMMKSLSNKLFMMK